MQVVKERIICRSLIIFLYTIPYIIFFREKLRTSIFRDKDLLISF